MKKGTQTYYYRARYYDPRIGRFLSEDPVGYIDGINLYTYVSNNPVNWVDPWGLCKEGGRKGITSQDILDMLLGVGTAYAGEIARQQGTTLPMPFTWRSWTGMLLMGAGGVAILSSPAAGPAGPAIFTGGVITFGIGAALTIWDIYASSKEAFEKTERIADKILRRQIEGYGFTKDELRELRLYRR